MGSLDFEFVAARKISDPSVVFPSRQNDTASVEQNNNSKKIADNNIPSCISVSALTACVIVIVCTSIFFGKDYIKYVLLSLEHSNAVVSFVVFSLLFTAVAFPITWGYILLNIAAGYLYGVFGGLVLVMVCAMFGITVANVVIRRFFQDFVRNRLVSTSMRTVIHVVESEHGFKAIVLARLTPIPFGLQNALFSTANIRIQRYVIASLTGMLPCQAMYAYVGSTLRSMEEVISSSPFATYVILCCQLAMVVALMTFVVRKARVEFDTTVKEMEMGSLSLVTLVDA